MKESTRRYMSILGMDTNVRKELENSKEKLQNVIKMNLPLELHKEADILVMKIIKRFDTDQYLEEVSKTLEKHFSSEELDEISSLYKQNFVLMKAVKLSPVLTKEYANIAERMLNEATIKELLVMEAEDSFALNKDTFEA